MPNPTATTLYASHEACPEAGWRWPHFSARELSCRCARHCKGEYFHDPVFLDALERLRDLAGSPLRINSARRCRGHNRAVGGASRSMHTRAIAADIALAGHNRASLARAAVRAGFTGIGFGRTFLHVDTGTPRRWTYAGALSLWIDAFGFDPVKGFARLRADP